MFPQDLPALPRGQSVLVENSMKGDQHIFALQLGEALAFVIAIVVERLRNDGHGSTLFEQAPDQIEIIHSRRISKAFIDSADPLERFLPEQQKMSQKIGSLSRRLQRRVVSPCMGLVQICQRRYSIRSKNPPSRADDIRDMRQAGFYRGWL